MYRPGCLEHYVLHQLRNDPAFVPELDFVMTLDGQLIGQNMFMKAVIAVDDGRSIPIMTAIHALPDWEMNVFKRMICRWYMKN